MTGQKPIPKYALCSIRTEAPGVTNLLEFLAITCNMFKVQGKLCQTGAIGFEKQINQAPVVQMMDSAVHRINRYPAFEQLEPDLQCQNSQLTADNSQVAKQTAWWSCIQSNNGKIQQEQDLNTKNKIKKSTTLNTEQCSFLVRSCTNLRRHSAGNQLEISLFLSGRGLNWEIKLVSPE